MISEEALQSFGGAPRHQALKNGGVRERQTAFVGLVEQVQGNGQRGKWLTLSTHRNAWLTNLSARERPHTVLAANFN